jgi:hypothetical protein
MYGFKPLQLALVVASLIAALTFYFLWLSAQSSVVSLESELAHELTKGKKPPYRNAIGSFKAEYVKKKLKALKDLEAADQVFDGPPDLPAGTAQLRINDSHLLAHTFPGTAFAVSWDLTYRPESDGIVLMSALNEADLDCSADLSESPMLIGEGFYSSFPNDTGLQMFSPLFLPLWKTMYFAGCVAQESPEGVVTWLGDRTNIVPMDYTRSPDLVVTDIFWETDGDVEFIVKNEGIWKKNPGLIRYHLRVNTYDHLGGISGSADYFGDAALTSISVLNPTESTGWDRAVDHVIPPGESKGLTVCINPAHSFVETNFDNNCLTKLPENLLPDLAVEDNTALYLRKPKEEDDGFWLWEAAKVAWDIITLDFEFDESGIVSDKFEFTITNTGQVTLVRYDVVAATYSAANPTESAFEIRKTLEEPLDPGESTTFFLYFETNQIRYDDPSQVYGTIMVDPLNTLVEFNETNNKKPLGSVQRDEE